jgi:sensor domain CHASE-containing protein
MPTAVPYLAFIARLSEVNLSLLSSILMLLLYNVIFILPEVVLLVIWLVNKEQIEKKLQKGKQIIQKLNQIITPILMFGIGMFLIIDSIFYLF